jgi:hypothetical protein
MREGRFKTQLHRVRARELQPQQSGLMERFAFFLDLELKLPPSSGI